jgi:membrane protease YdiL (CAAX protease family)
MSRPRWWGTLLYVPLLYGFGWLAVRPLALLAPGLRVDQLDLLGVVVAFALLLLSLPARLRRAWNEPRPWLRLGVTAAPAAAGRAFLRGLLKALLLLGGVSALLLLSGQARWSGSLSPAAWLNALALLLGVGFAEELLFRGWLWGELELESGPRRALLLQALIFALLHPWYQTPGLAAVGLLGGLILLGLALALQRRADAGLLWGAVGLHGGLVGGWFALQTGLLQLAPDTPAWLAGLNAGGGSNPLASLPGWLGLGLLLLARRRWW